jgi:hypothetical protein
VGRAWFVGGIAILASLPARSAFADEVPTAPAASLQPARSWYGAQTLIVDGVAVALVAISRSIPVEEEKDPNCDSRCPNFAMTASDVAFATGLSGYALGAPIVHLAHDHGGKAAASFGLHIVPTFLMLAGAAVCNEHTCLGPMLFGYATAALVSIADMAFIAYEDVPPPPKPSVSFSPWIDIAPRRACVGVGGTF